MWTVYRRWRWVLFFYLTNRKIHRYSYLISQYLSDADVWNGVVKGLPGPGYTGLWFLRKIRFFKAADSEIFIDNPVCPMANWGHEESLKKWPFVVFFSPAVKPLSTSSYHDVIATFSTQEQAVEFAQDITRAYKVSTLVGEFCYSVWWH
jgi:hypothetical protein